MSAQEQRPRFFQGQYLTPDDLTAIVEAQRIGDAHHALAAHTWGIAIGLPLTERAAPGAPNRVEVTLQPGFAWDGFGRPLAVSRPTRLTEALFAQIPFNKALDDDPVNGPGRLVLVWIAYDEIATSNPQPGFESCASDEQAARIGESFRFVIGQQSATEQRSPVTVGTASLDALDALTQFDAASAKLWDGSVPHQTFPLGKPPRWLVPLGLVRWIARDQALGYFVKRDLVATDAVEGRIRAFRRHVGVVAERIESAAGVIVLHQRGEDPTALHRYARLLGDPAKVLELQRDLVWVEGNLRVGGDTKINAGQLHFRDGDGEDRKTPLYLARSGDDQPTDGGRELRLALGDTTQKDNRLFVGPEETVGTKVQIAPRLVVVSGVAGNDGEGRVGVNTATPAAALEAKGDWAGNEDGALRLSGAEPTLRFHGGADVGQNAWIAQLGSQPYGALRFAHRTGPGSWQGVLNATPSHRVGIGADAPRNPLAIRGETSGTFDELISLEDANGATKWHLNLHTDPAGKALNLAETGVADGRLYLQAGGKVGIGTTNPEGRLTLEGMLQPAQGKMSFFSSQADVEYDGGPDRVFLFSQTTPGVTAFVNTRLGVGTTTPAKPLAVRATGSGEELVGFETPGGVTKWHINQALVGSPRGLNFVESGVADGRLFLREGGNVGVGTTSPGAKLHVNGDFVRVEGRANEQAYIGGDGAGGPDVQIGSFNAGVRQVHFWNTGAGSWMEIWGTWHGPSDARHKCNIEPLANSLDRVRSLKGVSYEWRTEPEGERPRRRLGLVAQDVQGVVPELVARSGRGDLGIDYQGLVGLLVGAVQELKDEVEALRAEVRALGQKVPARKPRA